ncbi:MAG: replicative DNA helicase [Actinobacteria bacterium]|nr:replicative DNA helicase [Actinomycetota bacterium]
MAVEPVTSVDRLPPHNLEAEESVLGSMMLSHRAAAEAQEILFPEDFYRESHRTIFKTLAGLYSGGSTTDPVVLAEELKRKGLLEAVGDRAYLYSLIDTTPNPHNVKHYAKIVRDMAIRRSLIEAGYDITNLGFRTDEEVDSVYDKAEQVIFRMGQRMRRDGLTHIKDPLVASFNRMSEAKERGSNIIGVPTEFYELDKITSGLQPSNLIVVGGRTSMGKTSFALNIAHNASVLHNIGVLIFSLEMSKIEIAERLLLGCAEVNSSSYRRGSLEEKEMDKIVDAGGVLTNAPIFIDDTGDISMGEMRSTARQLKAKEDIGLIVVDYIQLMYQKGIENRAQEVSKLARDLKVMAMELQVPVIVASQLRRPPPTVTKGAPSLEDLKESGGIEQNADVVILIYRPEVDDPKNQDLKGEVDINIAKHRNGETGKFRLFWVGGYSKFKNPAREDTFR